MFALIDGRRGTAIPSRAAGFDLTEHDQVRVAGDQIDLGRQPVATANPVALDNLEPEPAEMERCAILAPAASRRPRLVDRTQKSRFSRILAALPTRSRR